MQGSIERVLSVLKQAQVRFLIVGGVAVVLHGHLRTTADLDLVLEMSEENLRRAVRALSVDGFRPQAPVWLEAFADAERRQDWIESKGMAMLSLWHPDLLGFELDLLLEEPFDFEEVFARSVEVQLASCSACVLALRDLIELKKSASRPRDLEDIAALKAIEEAEARGDDE